MKEGFEFVHPNEVTSDAASTYGGVRKIKEQQKVITSFFTKGCLVFTKDTVIRAGKFKTNCINYIFPFFPSYIEYMLQASSLLFHL